MSNVTASSHPSTDFSAGTTSPEGDKRCATCAHRWSEHDVISARFCAATIASGSTRGCVCPSNLATLDPAVTD